VGAGEPVQAPELAVRVCPTTALPEIAGGEVLLGTDCVWALAAPLATTATSTAPTASTRATTALHGLFETRSVGSIEIRSSDFEV
jgi:hypothetical protein